MLYEANYMPLGEKRVVTIDLQGATYKTTRQEATLFLSGEVNKTISFIQGGSQVELLVEEKGFTIRFYAEDGETVTDVHTFLLKDESIR